MTYEEYSEANLLALCVWREARNQSPETQFAVGCSIRNRVLRPRWWGTDYRTVILKPFQYSSFNAADANAEQVPRTWEWALPEMIAKYVIGGTADTTFGAVSYFDKSMDGNPPKWSKSDMFKPAVDMGDFHFFKLAVEK